MLNAWGLHQVRLVWFVCVALLWAQVLPGQTPLTLAGPIRNATNGHDYYLLEPATWRNSEAAAVQLGGHLVTINSQEENLWIQETFSNFQSVKGDLWIGLMNPQVWTGPSDEAQWFNEFQWCSGQASVFRWWASGETAPTNGIRSGYCKMWGPSNLFERGQWAEEDPAASLNGVVEVVSQLEIVSSPQDVTTAIGGTVELNVVADGPAPIYYQWQFGGTNLPGATQPLLQLTNVRAAQAGAYVVVVSNAASQLVSAPATLTVSTLLMWGCYAHGETNVPADIGSLIAISGGDEFSLGLRADGTVVGWGQDLYGDVEIPAFLRDVVAIEAGGLHAVALRSDGSVVCWGSYGFGATTPPPGLSGVAAIAAGSGHTLAMKTNGTVISWGLNTGGGPPFEITNAVAVSSGGWQDLVLASDGQVVSWPFAAGQEAIAKVPPDLNNVVAISAGIDHSLALKADGKVVAWGNNNWGQINVPPGLSEVVAIAAGGYHSLALTADGKIVAWGSNPGGFPLAPPPVPNVNTIAAGYDHDLLLVGDGSPRITVQPWDRTVSCGASVCLAAKVVGAAPLTFQWRFNGVDIAGATSDSYLIGSSDLTNSGVYALSISNAFGKVETRGSLLVVTSNIYHPNQAPVLPSVSEVTIEQFNELSVTNAAVDPDGPASALSYRLLSAPAGMSIDGSGVIRWTPGPGQAPSTNIVITIVTDAGVPPMSATNSFTVTVSEWRDTPPTVIAGPFLHGTTGHRYLLLDRASWTNAEAAATALGGHLVTINNSEENTWLFDTFGNFGGHSRDLWIGLYDPQPELKEINPFKKLARYRWTSGQPFTTSPFSWGAGGPFDINHPSLGFFKLCGPGNPVSSGQALWADEQPSVALYSVVELPTDLEIVVPPQPASIGIGCDAMLRVFADGSSALSYQWQRSGTNLPGQTQSALAFTNIQFAESGTYSVKVSNNSGTMESEPAAIAVVSVVTWGSFPVGGDDRAAVPPGLTNVAAVAAGYFHDLALKADGTVVGWGQDYSGQTDVPPGLSNVIAIAAGAGHSLALRADGTVVAWGSTNGTMTQVPAGLTNVIAIDAGANNNLALKADGTVVAWGDSYAGPSVVAPGLSNVVAISAGAGLDLALLADGTVVDWNDSTGALNDMPADLTNAVAIAAGEFSALALRADGTVVGWGTRIDYGGSLKIPGDLTNVVGICLKWDHSLAMTASGTMVAAWGTNFSGESSVPPRLPNVVSIAGGYYHSIALLRDGAPNLTVQPWDRLVPQGSSVCVSAKAVSRKEMAYQWQFNGQDVPGATNDVLEIAAAQPAQAGLYTLSASNEVGLVVSRRAKLTISSGRPIEPPSLEILPLTNAVLNLRVAGPAGRQYILESATTAGSWVPIRTNIATIMPFEFTDSIQSGVSHRFYRVRVR